MKAGGGRQKGFGYEIEVSRVLSKWVTGKEKPDIFWRSAGSGAKSSVERIKGHETYSDGDIASIHERGDFFTKKFFIECKRYKEAEILISFFTGKGKVYEWWDKCVEQASSAFKQPILIIRPNNQPAYLITDCAVISELSSWFGEPFYDKWEFNRCIHVCYFKDWLTWADPDIMKSFCK